jgi:hypothetical protein
LGGHFLSDRIPQAFEAAFTVSQSQRSRPKPVSPGKLFLRGCPNLVTRMLVGIDAPLLDAICQSGMWKGSKEDLVNIVAAASGLAQPENLPLREAIDWVHAALYATVKVTKFTHLAPICGGPIDVATITSDRLFRWVRRKPLDAAI